MGFNNAGMAAMAARLTQRARGAASSASISAPTRTAPTASPITARASPKLAPLADYVTVNISSPNTPGLRGLQNRDELERLLATLTEERARARLAVPLLLKIAPDIDEAAMDDIAQVCLAAGIEGLIVTNTTIARPASLKSAHAKETGGLSGAPLFAPSTGVLKAMRKRVGTKLTLVGVGGIAIGRRRLCQDPRRREPGAALHRARLSGAEPDRPHQARAARLPGARRLQTSAKPSAPICAELPAAAIAIAYVLCRESAQLRGVCIARPLAAMRPFRAHFGPEYGGVGAV